MPGWNTEYRQQKYKEAREYERSQMTDCIDCGVFDLAFMDWHHVDPSNKVATVNRLKRDSTLEATLAEINKCICFYPNIKHTYMLYML